MASLAAAVLTGAWTHLAMPLTHLYATLVGVGLRKAPSSTQAPMAIFQACLLEAVTVVSRALALRIAVLASDEIQTALLHLAACMRAAAHLRTMGCCSARAVVVSAW